MPSKSSFNRIYGLFNFMESEDIYDLPKGLVDRKKDIDESIRKMKKQKKR